MRVSLPHPAPLLVADAVILALAGMFAGEGGPQVLYGFLSLVGGLLGTVVLYVAVGRWAIRRLELLEASVADRHTATLAMLTEIRHHLFGVQGVGGMRDEMRRSQRFRYESRQDDTVLFGVLYEHERQIVRLSERAGLEYEPLSIERRRRRAVDGDAE